MSSAFDRHIDECFAALDDVSIRQLEATAAALERRKDCLRSFAHVFSLVAGAREGGWDSSLDRWLCRRRSRRVATSSPTG